jgi:hypothetical protein
MEGCLLSLSQAGDTKKAIDCCVLLNQWDQGVTLAQQHNFPQVRVCVCERECVWKERAAFGRPSTGWLVNWAV